MNRHTMAEQARHTLGFAGRDLRFSLRRIYGTPEAAEAAIREKAQNKAELEHWGMVTTGESFSFADIPQPIREEAVISMAAAYLVWEHEQAGGIA